QHSHLRDFGRRFCVQHHRCPDPIADRAEGAVMKPARLRLAGLLLLIGVALGGAATGGYALGAVSSKPRVQTAEAPQAARTEEIAGVLRQIERRLARLEGSAASASARGTIP